MFRDAAGTSSQHNATRRSEKSIRASKKGVE